MIITVGPALEAFQAIDASLRSTFPSFAGLAGSETELRLVFDTDLSPTEQELAVGLVNDARLDFLSEIELYFDWEVDYGYA